MIRIAEFSAISALGKKAGLWDAIDDLHCRVQRYLSIAMWSSHRGKISGVCSRPSSGANRCTHKSSWTWLVENLMHAKSAHTLSVWHGKACRLLPRTWTMKPVGLRNLVRGRRHASVLRCRNDFQWHSAQSATPRRQARIPRIRTNP